MSRPPYEPQRSESSREKGWWSRLNTWQKVISVGVGITIVIVIGSAINRDDDVSDQPELAGAREYVESHLEPTLLEYGNLFAEFTRLLGDQQEAGLDRVSSAWKEEVRDNLDRREALARQWDNKQPPPVLEEYHRVQREVFAKDRQAVGNMRIWLDSFGRDATGASPELLDAIALLLVEAGELQDGANGLMSAAAADITEIRGN